MEDESLIITGTFGSTSSICIKLNSDLTFIWSKRISTSLGTYTAKEVAITPSQDIVISGYFVDLTGLFNAALISLDSSGSLKWVNRYVYGATESTL